MAILRREWRYLLGHHRELELPKGAGSLTALLKKLTVNLHVSKNQVLHSNTNVRFLNVIKRTILQADISYR